MVKCRYEKPVKRIERVQTSKCFIKIILSAIILIWFITLVFSIFDNINNSHENGAALLSFICYCSKVYQFYFIPVSIILYLLYQNTVKKIDNCLPKVAVIIAISSLLLFSIYYFIILQYLVNYGVFNIKLYHFTIGVDEIVEPLGYFALYFTGFSFCIVNIFIIKGIKKDVM
jgi:hypothetical protein